MRRSRTCSGAADAAYPSSPFDSVLGPYRRVLAPPFAMQFFAANETHRVRMDGTMHRIWHRHQWLNPFFSLLARADIFFPESGRDVPASMIVTQTREGVDWRRTFSFPRVRRFNATMTYRFAGEGRGGGSVIECVGPARSLEIPWQVRVLGRDTIEITTGRLMLRAGRYRLPIPGPLQVAVRVIERAVDDGIHVDLVLRHPILGALFGYEGTFAVHRERVDAEGSVAIDRRLVRYRGWFYAAAAYNLTWGTIAILWPASFVNVVHIAPPDNPAIWQALGMMVLVYCLLYTSPSPRDLSTSRMPSSA